jgi:hypothetical protein
MAAPVVATWLVEDETAVEVAVTVMLLVDSMVEVATEAVVVPSVVVVVTDGFSKKYLASS